MKDFGRVHVWAPQPMEKSIRAGVCPDCKKRTRFLSFFTEWLGWDTTCLRCGRMWSDGEWRPLEFSPVARKQNIEQAKRLWRKG